LVNKRTAYAITVGCYGNCEVYILTAVQHQSGNTAHESLAPTIFLS